MRSSKDKKLNTFESRVSELHDKRTSSTSDLAYAIKQAESLGFQKGVASLYEKLIPEIKSRNLEIDDYVNRLARLEVENKGLVADTQSKSTEIEKHSGSICAIRAQNSQMLTELSEKDNSIGELLDNITQLESQYKTLTETYEPQVTESSRTYPADSEDSFALGVASENARLYPGYLDGLRIRQRLRELGRPRSIRDPYIIELGNRIAHYGSAIFDASWLESWDAADAEWFRKNYGVDMGRVRVWGDSERFVEMVNWHFGMQVVGPYTSGGNVSSFIHTLTRKITN